MADNRSQIIISAKDETQAAFRSIRGSLESLTGLSLGGLLGVGSAAGLAAAVKSAADFADEMGKAASKVGTTTEALSGLKYAADLSDVSFETLQKGMEKLAKNADMAVGGSKEAAEAFARIKIDPKNFKDSGDLFVAVADKLSKLPDGAQKTALAMQLLDKSGAEMIPLLNEGAAGIQRMREEADRLGVVIGGDTAKAAQEYNDNMERLSALARGLSINLVNDMAPALADISKAMVQAAKDGGLFQAALVGIGGALAHLFGMDDASQAKDRLSAIGREISKINGELAGGVKRTDKGIVGMSQEDVQAAITRLKALAVEKANLEKSLKPPESTPTKPTANADRVNDGKKTGRKGTSIGDLWLDDMQLAAKQSTAEEKMLADAMKQVEDALNAQAAAWADMAALQSQSDAFGLADIEAASAAEQDHIESLNRKADAYRELLDPSLKMLNTEAELNDMLANGVIDGDEYTAMLKKLGEQSDKTNNLAKDIGLTFSSAFEDAVSGGKKFSDVLKSLAMDIEKLLIRKSVTEPLTTAVSGWFDSQNFGSGISDFFSGIFGGGRAVGGSVDSGKAYIVGERGPELLVGASGRIIPNSALGGSGANVTVNVINNAQAQASVNQRPDGNGGLTLDVIIEPIKSALIRDMSRGGDFGSALENQYGLNRAAGATR